VGQNPRIGSRTLWPTSIAAAREIQERLAKKVRLGGGKRPPKLLAGVDAAFSGNRVYAAACLFSFPSLKLVEEAVASMETQFPYVPGYLTFREGPAILQAVLSLGRRPDLILVDGQGIAHPRGIGSASHIGVLLGIPTIGCAKSRLVGESAEPGRKKGDWASLVFRGKIVGAVVRTREGVKPLFVSPGHRISRLRSVEIVLASTAGYRIPEPLRRADLLSKKLKRPDDYR
jgi:deoxyribonuclease V